MKKLRLIDLGISPELFEAMAKDTQRPLENKKKIKRELKLRKKQKVKGLRH